MSNTLSGQNLGVFPYNLDGMQNIDVASINGQTFDPTKYVKYSGNTAPLDMGAFNIKTAYAATATTDVVNLASLNTQLSTLTNYIIGLNGLNYVKYTNSTSNTDLGSYGLSASALTATSSLTVNGTASLTNLIKTEFNNVLPGYSPSTVAVGNNFGTITNTGGVYQSTSTAAFASLNLGAPAANQPYIISLSLKSVDVGNNTNLYLYGSTTPNMTGATGSLVAFSIPPNTSTFTTFTNNITFPAGSTYLLLVYYSQKPSGIDTLYWNQITITGLGSSIKNLITPTTSLDAANKLYVDNKISSTSSLLVPYTGASSLLNLGSNSLTASTAKFTAITSATPTLALGVDALGNLNSFAVPTATNLLPLNNTWTGSNTYNAGIQIAAGSLGVATGNIVKQSATALSYTQITGGNATNSPYMEYCFGGYRRGYIGNATATDFFIVAENNAQLSVDVGGARRMSIATNGNTTIASPVFDVNNTLTTNSNNISFNLRNNASNPSNFAVVQKSLGSGAYHSLTQAGDTLLLSMDQQNGVTGANGIVIAGWNQTAGLRIGTSSSQFSGALTVSNDVLANGVTINGGGTYQAGSIYSDVNWGMLFRAKVAGTNSAFGFHNSVGTQLMNITNGGVLTAGQASRPVIIGDVETIKWSNPNGTLTHWGYPSGGGSDNYIRGTYTYIDTPLALSNGTYVFNAIPENTASYARVMCMDGDTLRRGQCMQKRLYQNASIGWGGGVNLVSAFYKWNQTSVVRISGKYSGYWTSVGLAYIYVRIHSQTNGADYGLYLPTYTNNTYNHVTIPLDLVYDGTELPTTGWFDLYIAVSSGLATDGGDQLTLNVSVLPANSF